MPLNADQCIRYCAGCPLRCGRALGLAVCASLCGAGGHAQAVARGRIVGSVRTDQGAPAVGMSVSLATTPLATATDSGGAFVLQDVAIGIYTVVVSGRDVDTLRTLITVLGGQTTRLALVVAPRGRGVAPPGLAQLLPAVVVRAPKAGAMSNLPEVRGTVSYAGQKTEVVSLDSLTVNTAEDKSREVLGRVPGVNIAETESSGFPSNGIGLRGLNPTQSIEMNVRQDGVNIVADLYGYPETYYTPPAEAVERIEFVRGSASLQFGPQFGGVVDYVLRDGQPNTPPTFTVDQTGGTYGLFDSYLSVGGGSGRWTYFGYAQYRGDQGWRSNSDISQVSAAGRVHYQASDHVRLSLEYSLLRNQIHMPGGLTDSAFQADPGQSLRARNWLATPWNVVAASVEAELSPKAHLTSTLSYMFSQRYLVWRNEDGGPGAIDSIDPTTLTFIPREVEREYFNNATNETRLRWDYRGLGATQTFITGLRVFSGTMHRQEGGVGTTGSDFDMSLVAPYGTDVSFGSTNVAGFAENIFHVGHRLSIIPGIRVEFLRSTTAGYADDSTFAPLGKNRTFALAGLSAQYDLSGTNVYGNLTQAYRPIEYSYLYPIGSATRVDRNLVDPTGYNADLGWRGELGTAVSFDLGIFYLYYHNRIDIVSLVDSTGPYTEYENTGTSVHEGVETYLSVRPLSWLGVAPASGTVELWEALGYTHARYTAGAFTGNTVEYAPAVVSRFGASFTRGRATLAVTWSLVTKQYTDANNTITSADGETGVIPSYGLVDGSVQVRCGERAAMQAGVNNLANVPYFTMRTTEYPGPGIIPGLGRTGYLTFRLGM